MFNIISSGDLWYALALSGLFAGIFLLISALIHLAIIPWRRRRTAQRRVREARISELAQSGIFRSEFVEPKSIILRAIEKIFGPEKLKNLQSSLFQADIFTGLGRFVNLVIIAGCFGFIVGWSTPNLLWRLTLTCGCACLPFLYLRFRKQRKARLIEQQMPDAMELLARSLRAGHTLPAAVDLAAQEIPPPLGSELHLAHEEQRLGIGMAEALEHLADRTTSRDLRYFVTAVMIQYEVGGNLAELMDNIGSLIRARLNLKAKVMALSSHVRLSAAIVTVLPFVLFLVLYKLNPAYMSVLLHDPKGFKLLSVGVVSIALGSLVMRRMSRLTV
jgi:tight adherence protein B